MGNFRGKTAVMKGSKLGRLRRRVAELESLAGTHGLPGAVERLGLPTLLVDHRQRIVAWNRPARSLLGLPEGSHPQGKGLAAVLETGTPTSLSAGGFEAKARRADGEAVLVRCTAGPRGPEGTVLVLQDISELVRLRRSHRRGRDAFQRLRSRLDEATREERSRVARDIHDGLLQSVIAAQLLVEQLAQGPPPAQAASLAELALHWLQEALAEGRRAITGLRPVALEESGLTEALRALLADRGRESGVEMGFEARLPEEPLPYCVETNLFRIVQEAVANITKHAQAPRVAVSLWEEEGLLHLRVRDWGRGFDPRRTADEAPGFGLRSMKERARLLGGALSVQSQPGQGTVLEVTVPRARPTPPSLAPSAHEPMDFPEFSGLSKEEAWALLHQLQVQQMELEMQNAELRWTQLELERTRDAYRDLYEHAPVGYLTLDAEGRTVGANVTAAVLLGQDRPGLLGRWFPSLASSAHRGDLEKAVQRWLATSGCHTCETCLHRQAPQGEFRALLECTSTVEGENGPCARIVLRELPAAKGGRPARCSGVPAPPAARGPDSNQMMEVLEAELRAALPPGAS